MPRALSPACHLHPHHFPGTGPQSPTYAAVFWRATRLPSCLYPPYPNCLGVVSLPLWSDPFLLCPRVCQGVGPLPPGCWLSLHPPPWPLPLSWLCWLLPLCPTLREEFPHLDLPGLSDNRETQEGETDQPHVVHTELCQGRHHWTGEVDPKSLEWGALKEAVPVSVSPSPTGWSSPWLCSQPVSLPGVPGPLRLPRAATPRLCPPAAQFLGPGPEG